jgi:hypothetical protein
MKMRRGFSMTHQVKQPHDLTHEEKDNLIRLTKKELELVCARLSTYEGLFSESAHPEHWVGRAYLMTQNKGWKKNYG